MTKLEEIARAIDPGAWMNLDNYLKVKGIVDIAEVEERKRNSHAISLSIKQAIAAVRALREPDEEISSELENALHDWVREVGTNEDVWTRCIDRLLLADTEEGR